MDKQVQSKQKILTGSVISNKVNGQVTVKMVMKYSHPKYGRVLHKTGKYIVSTTKSHELGDAVRFVSIPKISKTKSFKEVE